MLVGQFQQDKSTPATAVPPSSVCITRHRTAVHGTDTWTAEVARQARGRRGRVTPRRVFID